MDYLELGYFGLFLVCFLAATILPLASEGALIVFLTTGYDPILCLMMASVGNTLGGLTNYVIGMFGKVSNLRRFFKSEKRYNQLNNSIEKYGYWLALLTWLPFVGDPLAIALGFFRVRFLPVLILMFTGKFVRYYFIVFLFN